MSKVRVYEVAKDLGLANKDLVAMLQSLGFDDVRNHMSALEPEQVERVKRKLARKDGDKDVVDERVHRGVIRRRAKPDAAPAGPVSSPGPVSAAGHGAPAGPASSAGSVATSGPASSAGLGKSPTEMEAPVSQKGALEPTPSQRGDGAAARSSRGAAGRKSAAGARESRVAAVESAAHDAWVDEATAPARIGAQESGLPVSAAASVAVSGDAGSREPSAGLAVQDASAASSAGSTDGAAAGVAPIGMAPVGVAPTAPVRAAAPTPPPVAVRPSQPPKSGIQVWEGRPGVPMPQRPQIPAGARRTTYDPRAAAQGGRPFQGPPAAGGRPGFMRPGMRTPMRRGPAFQRRRGTESSTKEMSAHKMVIRIEGETSLQSLAQKMALKATDVLMKLLSLGMTGVHINSTLDSDTAKLLASEFGWTVEDVSVSVEEELEQATHVVDEEPGESLTRPPVVTVMGHVDHGKTTLLDTIRRAQVAAGEAGGITQHIGAYRVEKNGATICFLDTPGHEAFSAMRARGASLTDLVILVVAADDGVMPQTKEAIIHAKSAEVPLIVAINKIDKPGVDPERIMRELTQEGLTPEEWGGETIFVRVSGKTGQGVDQLLEMINIQAEMLDLRAQPTRRASGIVIEALLDRGRGPVARVLVQDGTLQRGDVLLAGTAFGKIRAMTDEKGRMLKEAGPSTPVEVLGLNEVPNAGDPVHAVKDLKSAEGVAEERRKKQTRTSRPTETRFSLETLRERLAEAEQLELKIIIKADVQGSAEALSQALAKLSTKKVKLSIVHTGVGGITESDVNLATASGSIIVGFNVRPAGKAKRLAEQEGVEMRLYTIIYEVLDDVRLAMEGLLPATKVEKELGKAEVRTTFRISKVGTVAGCMVTEGVVKRSAHMRLVRDAVVVWTGKLDTLKRFKDDAREVREGLECGIALEGFSDVKDGDIFEVYEFDEVKAKLED